MCTCVCLSRRTTSMYTGYHDTLSIHRWAVCVCCVYATPNDLHEAIYLHVHFILIITLYVCTLYPETTRYPHKLHQHTYVRVHATLFGFALYFSFICYFDLVCEHFRNSVTGRWQLLAVVGTLAYKYPVAFFFHCTYFSLLLLLLFYLFIYLSVKWNSI